MKRKNIIILLWILWVVIMIGMVFGVYYYINNKRIRLRSEIRENIESIFEGQSSGDMFVSNNDGFFDVAYSGSPVRHYKKVAIPPKPSKGGLAALDPSIDEKIDDWKQSYGDLSSLYELNWGDKYPNQEDDGWNIIRIYCSGYDDDFIQTNIIFPYKVGLKKMNGETIIQLSRQLMKLSSFILPILNLVIPNISVTVPIIVFGLRSMIAAMNIFIFPRIKILIFGLWGLQ